MKFSKYIMLAVCALGLTYVSSAEARHHHRSTHFSLNLGTPVVQERVQSTYVVERHYRPYAYRSPRCCYEEVYVVPAYRERVYTQPSVGFGLGFFFR